MGKHIFDGRLGSVLGSTEKQWQGRRKSIAYPRHETGLHPPDGAGRDCNFVKFHVLSWTAVWRCSCRENVQYADEAETHSHTFQFVSRFVRYDAFYHTSKEIKLPPHGHVNTTVICRLMHNYAVLVINWDKITPRLVLQWWQNCGVGGGERGTLLRLCYRQYEAIERWNTVKHFAQFPSQTICLWTTGSELGTALRLF